MLKTGGQLVQESYYDLCGNMPGQATSQDILNHGLTQLNEMLDSWRLDQLNVPDYPASIFTLTPGIQSYTIGPVEVAPNFTAPRPENIEAANVIINTVNPVIRQPMQVLCVTYQQWSAIRVQQLPNAIPLILYYVKDFDPVTGAATINVWPGPLSNYQLELYTWDTQGVLAGFNDLTTPHLLRPGWTQAIRKNLAKQLIPSLRMNLKIVLDPETRAQIYKEASDSLARVQSYNAPAPVLACDEAMLNNRSASGYNYLLGTTGPA